ncbi:MAG: glycosyltransferase family 2 protein [Candidatus Dojkabacteria bacterium]
MIHRPKLSVIIPVWNEIKTVEEAVRRIYALDVDKEIIVIDDFSTDGSRELLRKLRPELKLKLILHAKNKGKGAAVKAGIAHAKGEYVVVEDADSELDPNDILKMLSQIENDQSIDLIAGTRIFPQNANITTGLARWVTRLGILILFQRNITDPLCAYKLCKLSKFKGLKIQSERFGIEAEWLVKGIKKGWKINEFPVKYIPRGKKEGKKIELKDGFDIVAQLIKLRFSS